MEHGLNIAPFIFLMALIGAVEVIANRVKLPSPILLVVIGIAVGFLPFNPPLTLEPALVFTLFLPPLLHGEAWFASFKDLKFNLRIMVFLAFGLVIATTVAIGYGMHLIWPALGLASAMVLGAIISPPDAVAASAIIENFRIPRRVVTILQEESLLNDATALVVYGLAVTAIVTGQFSLQEASISFVYKAVLGTAIGLVCAATIGYIWDRLDNAPVEILMSLIVPYMSYTVAETFHTSGILAVVTGGMYLGAKAPQMLSPWTRVQGKAFWTMFLFGVNGMVFLLTGIQLPLIIQGLKGHTVVELLAMAITLNLLLFTIRMVWVFAFSYVPRMIYPKILEYDPWPKWQNVFLIGFSGMRGVVSLAAALALPMTIQNNVEFPQRDLILFLTFSTIMATTVLQGLLMPHIIRWLDIQETGCINCDEEEAKHISMQHAVSLLQEYKEKMEKHGANGYHPKAIEDLHKVFNMRLNHYQDRVNEDQRDESRKVYDDMSDLHQQILQRQRQAIIGLRDEGRINDDIMHRLIEDLDFQEVRLLHT